jgi:hypothetical protein
MNTFGDRITRAGRLDVTVYEEVERDRDALPQALAVVVLSSLAAGLGGVGGAGFSALLSGTVSALLGWFLWAYLVYLLGTRVFPEARTETDYGEVLRTTGFAAAPGLIRVVGIIPGLWKVAFWVAGIWMLLTMILAVRQALDYQNTVRAAIVCVLGWIAQYAILAFLWFALGVP